MKDQIAFYEMKLAFELDAWDLMESIEKDEKIIIIDTRSKETYDREHIIGAINFPHRTMSFESMANFSRSAQYVTYCDGIGCNASTKGALNMARLGFTVKELIGGIDWWKRDGYVTEGTEAGKTVDITCGC